MKRHTKTTINTILAAFALLAATGCHNQNVLTEKTAAKQGPAAAATVAMNGETAGVPTPAVANARPAAGLGGRVVGSKYVTTAATDTVAADDVMLLIDSGAVRRDVQISIVSTTEEHTGEIPSHMENLTAGGAVYRMLPDGQKFEKDITIAMRYDSTALPYGYTAEDIYTFFYNEETHLWQQVERDSVDTKNQIVYSRTNHFTDYINGVLKVPESSDVTTYTPTSIKDLKAADPLEGITMIAPPEANNMGTANLSYPLTIPAGRHGMQPQLSVNYNSAGGSGILGLGWSLPISEISVETRWGVPLFDPNKETEGYILDGTTLVTSYTDELGNFRLNKPVYHRAYDNRDLSGKTQFYPRVEGSFRRIERFNTTTKDYYWVVTDKDGTQHYYGQTRQARLTDKDGNIAKWMLEKSVDTYGNTVTYAYTTKYTHISGEPYGKQLCINRIYYTGFNSSRGSYIIRFNYVEKHDKSNSFRYGLEEINNFLLDRIEVMFRDSIVREYYFGYKEGEFGKTLLCKIFEGYDDGQRNQLYSTGNESNTIRNLSVYQRCSANLDNNKKIYMHIFHAFDYYGLDTNSISGGIFGKAETLQHLGNIDHSLFNKYDTPLNEKNNIGGSGSAGWNVYGGGNVGCDYIPYLKTFSAGGHYSYSEDYSEGFLQMVDINGDGYPDKLYKNIFDNVLRCRPQIPGSNTFDEPIEISGVNSFLYTESSTDNYGWEASAAVIGTGKSWSDGRSNTYTYVSDVNGDGLVDIVDNGCVYINRGNYRFDDVTNNDTIRVGGTCEGEAIDFYGEVDSTMFEDGDYTIDSVVCIDSVYAVPVWDVRYVENGYYEEYISHYDTVPYDTCYTITKTVHYSYPKRYEPQVDLVRMWKAPYAGNIEITGTAKLTDDLRDFRSQTRTNDGVWVSIQRAGETNLRLQATVTPDNPHTMNCTINNINAGDTIFFRINALDKRLYDHVEWIPTIEYTSATHRNNESNSSLSMLDANGVPIYKFNYAEDFMLTENQSVMVGPESVGSCTNKFSVYCELKSTKPLTQDMKITVYRAHINSDGTTGTETPLFQAWQTYSKGSILNDIFQKNNLVVSGNEKLIIRLSVPNDGQLNWADIKADATVTLTYSSDATINNRLSDPDARLSYIYHPAVQRTYYDYLVFPASTISLHRPPLSMYVHVLREDNLPFTGILHMTIKDPTHNLCFSRDINITSANNGQINTELTSLNLPYGSDYQYYVDFYTDDIEMSQKISDIKYRVLWSSNSPLANPSSGFHDAGLYAKFASDGEQYKNHGTLYRGWGQFGYQSPDGELSYINSNDIKPGKYYNTRNEAPKPSDNDIDSYGQGALDPDGSPTENPAGEDFNPLARTFFEMDADPKNHRWKSYASLVTASDVLSSLDNNVNPAVESGEEQPRVNMFQSPLPVVAPGTKMKAVNKMMMNKGTSRTKREATESTGYSRLLGDYMDMNGDRYPDNVSEKVIQYSRAQGGLSNKEIGFPESYISHTENSSIGKAKNGTFMNMMFESAANAKKSRAMSRVSGLFQLLKGLGDKTTATDAVKSTVMDINGDGLADIVYVDNTVRYNMGYGFTARRSLSVGQIRSSRSVSGGTGFGFNVGNTSISGSVSVNESNNGTVFALMDVNGDGLPDKVSPYSVEFNQGNGTFVSPSVYTGMDMDNGLSLSFCLNVSATYDAVFSVFGVPVKVGGSAGGGGSVSLSQSKGEFVDMNNDGFVDYVFLEDGKIKVRYSNIGRANLLRFDTNFAGARMEIDYSLSTATEQSPQRHWNMSSLAVYDGHDGDGVSTMYKRFDYGNRNYDRYERDDYGYDTVKIFDYESPSSYVSNNVYRTTTQEFLNEDYYHRGLKKRERTEDNWGGRYVENRYTYRDADLRDGHYLGDTKPWCEGDGWPALAEESTHQYEGSGSVIVTKRKFNYGAYGNVTGVKDYGKLNYTDDDYSVEIGYDLHPVSHIVANVSKLDIPGYRNRTATYTPEGSLETLTVDNAPSPSSIYSYKYDNYGNVVQVTTPAVGHNSLTNYEIYYTYDPVLHMLPINVTNIDGYGSHADYSYRWQKPLNTYDISGNRMRYTYDSHGRTSTITAPNELNANKPYTVKYNYWNSGLVKNPDLYNFYHPYGQRHHIWARTYNYDPEHPTNNIETVTFSDGLARLIQVKKDVAVNGQEVRSVGGTVHYDGLGRKCTEFFLNQESLSGIPDTILNVQAANWSTTYSYDYLDRLEKTVFADGTNTLNKYYVDNDVNGDARLVTEATDQNGHVSKIYTDPRQLNMQLIDALGHITTFHYDAIGQLEWSKDPEGHATTHKYDLGGRRIDRDHPSAGHTHWDYDAAGNMIMQTQNSGEYIKYLYDYTRPLHIAYSDRPWNNVWYKYGPAGSGNETGRLVCQQDATGVQEFRYDCMGNVIMNKHTYVQPGSLRTFTLRTEWEYDSWGRVKTILYPDKEKVNYSYDFGGNVCHIEGYKTSFPSTTYIKDLQYDLYEQRVYQLDGNGVETHYSYDPQTRRLSSMYDQSPSDGILQMIKYTYDYVGNITMIDDIGRHQRNQTFEYDDINRLIESNGNWEDHTLDYKASYQYSDAGRMLLKEVNSKRLNDNMGVYNVDYNNKFTYFSDNPFAVKNIDNDGINTDFKWDANGNLVCAGSDKPRFQRNLCWTEDNRLQGYRNRSDEEGDIAAWYNYNAGGERNLKITTPQTRVRQNAIEAMYVPALAYPTLYASALITLTRNGYTKHYYEGTNRVCSKLGGGFATVNWGEIETPVPELANDYHDQVIGQDKSISTTFGRCLNTEVEMQISSLYDMLMHEHNRPLENEKAFYYHSDHLGSASYLTDDGGQVTQMLNYLPYGEDWIDVRNNLDPRLGQYTFNGKEKDYESGFHYYGARYYWSEILTGWLSVDPMMDKYPNVSPYAYCVWNPVKLVDPDGNSPLPSWREFLFAIKHPVIASRVGSVSHGSSNISTCAVRFATRGEVLSGSNPHKEREEGSEAGAFRHTLWQATIAANYGTDIAKEIGDAHEDNPEVSLKQRTFDSKEAADQVVDLLNNIIGRSIGKENSGESMKSLANTVLDEFKNNGLYTATETSDGKFSVSRNKLSQEKYDALKGIFSGLNEFGRTETEQYMHYLSNIGKGLP